jgi:L-ascorbate metabolism protein UlaG (beta-lactamase superfamily)
MIQITWLGHATFELQFPSGEVLVIDPFIQGNPAYPKDYEIKKVDVIAVSHAHSDHIGDVTSLAEKFKPKIIAMVETASWLEQRGLKNTVGMNKGGTVDVGFAKVTMTHALHSSGITQGKETLYGGEPAGYVISSDGRAAYFAGDTDVFSDMALIAELYSPELAFLPIGDHYTMGPRGAALAARLLKVKRVIPMHYGTFPVLVGRPEQLVEELKERIGVWTLKQGDPVQW